MTKSSLHLSSQTAEEVPSLWETPGLASQIFEATPAAVMITEPDGRILAVNPAFTRITGYQQEEVVGQNPRMLASGVQSQAFYADFWRQLLETGAWQGQIWNRRKNGMVYSEWLNINGIYDNDGNLAYFVAIFSDISKTQSGDERLLDLANHDPLTGLANRRLFNDRLSQAASRARRNGHSLILLYMDVDGFKGVNDALGHPKGDEILKEIASKLTQAFRDCDTIARLGGDEFVVLLEGTFDPEQLHKRVGGLLEACEQQIDGPSGPICTSLSLGIAAWPEHTKDPEELEALADTAMYAAKTGGRNQLRFAL